jgi:hypothetical protein
MGAACTADGKCRPNRSDQLEGRDDVGEQSVHKDNFEIILEE